jgi:hypothetical protein
MKTLYAITFLLFTYSAINAQVYFEDFENGMPEDYHLVNIDGLTPDDPDLSTMTDSAWTVKPISAQGWENGYSAFSVSWYEGDAGPSNDWMVTSAIEIGDASVLSWDAMAITSSGIYRDRYQVFIGNDTSIASFELLAPIFDTQDTGEVVTPITRSYDLAANGYADEVIYVAFRNWTNPYDPNLPDAPGNGGNELVIDNITVTGTTSINEYESSNLASLKLYPNPANEYVSLSFDMNSGDDLTIYIYNELGKLVKQQALPNTFVGANKIMLSVADLSGGSYLVHVLGENTKAIERLQIVR